MNPARKGWPVLRWGRAKIVEVFGADLRSLAAFRIVLALLVLADLANRSTDLYAHYTDKGILPRTVLMEEVLNRSALSLSLMSGELWFQALLFGMAALAALALLVGYCTRLMTVVVWVLLVSIQWRNPLVLSAGDDLLRMLLFWSMLLPLGAYWSVDRALESSTSRLSTRSLSMATVGLFMQIAFMYWFTAIQKSGDEWRVDGTALYYALSIDQVATPIGAYLHQFPTLLTVLTFATLGLEVLGPFLLFCPVFTGLVRTGTVLTFMSLHFGIWLTMDLDSFPWISAFCMVCFLPGWFWENAGKLRTTSPEQPAITRRLQHAASHLANAYQLSVWARAFTTVGAGRSPVAGVVEHSDGAPAPSAASALGKIRPFTKATSRWRTRLCTGVGSGSPMLRSSLVINLLALFLLLYVFLWNLTTVSSFTMPERVVPIGHLLGLKQSWGMFAPSPSKNDGWYVIPGTLRSGQQVDLMSVTREDFRPLEGVSWEKPQYVNGTFENNHWRKYLNKIGEKKHSEQRQYLGRYICREWNARHAGDEQLMTLQITYMLEKTLPDYQSAPPERVVLREHSCS